jgi:hypothetical protein
MNVVAASGSGIQLAILRPGKLMSEALARRGRGMGGGEHAHLYRVQEALARLEGKDCTH